MHCLDDPALEHGHGCANDRDLLTWRKSKKLVRKSESPEDGKIDFKIDAKTLISNRPMT